jgi:methionyl-tRNA synthetase
LAQRSLSMITKNCAGVVPEPGPLTLADEELLSSCDALHGRCRAHMQNWAMHAILADIWRVVAEANRYFAAEEPWIKRKTDPERMRSILYVTAEVLRGIALMAQPVMPAAMEKLLNLLGIGPDERNFAATGAARRLQPGTPLPTPQAIFPRYVEPEGEPAASGAQP